MKTKMRATSLLAFYEILGELGFKEMLVFQTIKKIQPCSDSMIAQSLNWKINCVTGRRNSLMHYKTVILYKKDIDKCYPHKKVCYWIIPSWLNSVLIKENPMEIK